MTRSACSTCSMPPGRRCVWLRDGGAKTSTQRTSLSPYALVQLISVIGEAAGKVSPNTCSELYEVPWPDIVSMRNRLIHAYFDINLDILWATVQDSLPPLIRALESALGETA